MAAPAPRAVAAAAARAMSTLAARARGRVVRGVVFDMDGTLTDCKIDFAAMRARTGVLEGDILAVIESWECAERKRRAHAIIEDEEARGVAALTLAAGVHPLLRRLDAASIPRGLVTRNNAAAVAAFHDKLSTEEIAPFKPALDRGYGGRPKPAPDAVAACAAAWGVCPTQVVVVGDSLVDDVAAGNAAGAATILIDAAGRHGDGAHYEPHLRPTAVATCLDHVGELLDELFELVPP